jgi:hypothetical protein
MALKSQQLLRRESFILKQTYFIVNNDMQQHGNILTYNLLQFDSFKNDQLPEDGQVGPKHVAIFVILMSF